MIQSIKEATANQYVQPQPQPQPQQEPQPQQQQQQQPQFEADFVPHEDEFSVVGESNNSGNGIKPDIIVAPKRRGRPKR